MDRKTIVEVDGEGVFTCRWVMEQMQSLMKLHSYNRRRLYFCYAVTAVSLLLSLAAFAIAAM